MIFNKYKKIILIKKKEIIIYITWLKLEFNQTVEKRKKLKKGTKNIKIIKSN